MQFLFSLINYPRSLIRSLKRIIFISFLTCQSIRKKSQCTSWIRKQRLYKRTMHKNAHTIIDEKGEGMDSVHNCLRALVMGMHFSEKFLFFFIFFLSVIFFWFYLLFCWLIIIVYQSLYFCTVILPKKVFGGILKPPTFQLNHLLLVYKCLMRNIPFWYGNLHIFVYVSLYWLIFIEPNFFLSPSWSPDIATKGGSDTLLCWLTFPYSFSFSIKFFTCMRCRVPLKS